MKKKNKKKVVWTAKELLTPESIASSDAYIASLSPEEYKKLINK
jgi:hypothetical protein